MKKAPNPGEGWALYCTRGYTGREPVHASASFG